MNGDVSLGSRFRVLIAGGGVAGVEALLALKALAAEFVDVELLAPTERFVYRPLVVAEPFGTGGTTSLDLGKIVKDAGARHRRDALAAVEPRERVVRTASGERLRYDALLVAPGARAVEAVAGALTFSGKSERARFADTLTALGRKGMRRLAFVVPSEATWSIAAYELALLTAAECEARGIGVEEIAVVTHEPSPLHLFGAAASQLVAARLEEAGIALHGSRVAQRFDEGRLRFGDGESLAVDQVVALPALEVPPLAGLPQGPRGFVPTDVRMRVVGLEDVWAAGDASSFPIKQGGLAAQQADVAARTIAARAGARVPVEPFQPVLRGALITGRAPDYLRARLSERGAGEAVAGQALWWPPTKLAGQHLGPYVSGRLGGGPSDDFLDLEPAPVPTEEEANHERAVRLVLAAADADARVGDFPAALRWLSLVEHLNLVIPAKYVARRDEWRRQLHPDTEPDAAARRIDPRFQSAAEAISDLQRRLGWLRELQGRGEAEMRDHLSHLEAGIEDLTALAKKTGNYRPRGA